MDFECRTCLVGPLSAQLLYDHRCTCIQTIEMLPLIGGQAAQSVPFNAPEPGIKIPVKIKDSCWENRKLTKVCIKALRSIHYFLR